VEEAELLAALVELAEQLLANAGVEAVKPNAVSATVNIPMFFMS
jgi:DNA-binding transcriptional regulator YbjK